MDKVIWKPSREWSYFIGNILVQLKHVFLPDYPLLLSLLKHKSFRGIFEQKKSDSNRKNSLNSSI